MRVSAEARKEAGVTYPNWGWRRLNQRPCGSCQEEARLGPTGLALAALG